ncbi:33698_t:CDS:2, partial [Gigaspora margarita]
LFLTYRKFLTPIKLCKLLILRFDWALGGDDEERRIVRVRTFVVIRHWLLNYFAYDFIPCRALRTTLTKYLNSLPSHQLDSTGIKESYKEVKENVLLKECHGLREKKVMVDSGGGSGVSTSLIEDSINIINIAVSYDSSNYYTILKNNPLYYNINRRHHHLWIQQLLHFYTPNINGVT